MDDPAARRRQLREELRAARRALSAADQAAASMAVMARIASLPVLDRASIVAGYRAVRGELDIDASLSLLTERGTTITLPRVVGEHLEFVESGPDNAAAVGRFGIVEPTGHDVVPISRHDVVLAPLVAFDAEGHRLGQGGGHYDRALAARTDRPVLIGVGHAFQQVDQIPVESWDVTLDAVVTDERVEEFTPGVLGS